MTTGRVVTSPRSPDHLGLPPPALELRDAERVVGRVHEDVIAFRGFGSVEEAAHAAWVAHRALARRLAPRDGRRSIPVDTARLALDRRGDEERVLANGQPIATLRRPAADAPGGDATFGFALRVPRSADAPAMHSLAYVAYRALRKSGVRWALWARDERRPERDRAVRTRAAQATSTRDPASGASPQEMRWGLTTLGLVAIAVVALVAPPAIGLLIAIATLGAIALVGVLETPLVRWVRWVRRQRRSVRRPLRAGALATLVGHAHDRLDRSRADHLPRTPMEGMT